MLRLLLVNVLFLVLASVYGIDTIIKGEQGKDCHVSNFCERTLTLKHNQRKKNRRQFDVSDDPTKDNVPGAWKVVKPGAHYKKRGRRAQLIIKSRNKKNFEVRETCVNVMNVKRIDYIYNLPDDRQKINSISVSATNVTKQVCVKKPNTEHIVVSSIQLTFVPGQETLVLSALIFVACGDLTEFGSKNTVPNVNTTKATLQRPAREECFDQVYYYYGNRELQRFNFTDGKPGENEFNALDGSGETYSGEEGENVQFIFSYLDSKGKNKKDFVWWRVCMLMRNVKTVTYRLGGELNDLVEKITVCEASNYLWKCYNPWGRFHELTTGYITLEPADRNAKIMVSTMSISICLDNEFKGEIVRIGKASVKCKETTPGTSICFDMVRIQKSDLVNFTSPFDLTHDTTQRNTSRAWKAVSRTGLTVGRNKTIVLAYTLNKVCAQNPDGLFQSRTVSFWGWNVGKIVVKYCDTEMKIGVGSRIPDIFCKTGNNDLTIFNDTKTGKTEERRVESAKKQKFTLNYWNPVTAVKITIFPKVKSEGMTINWFNIYACCIAKRRPLKDIGEEVGKEQRKPRITGNHCKFSFTLQYPKGKQQQDVFSFDDRDEERDEKNALEGSDKIYIGAPGKNIYFYIAFTDGQNFEWWKVCGYFKYIKKITYIMETSRVTFIQSITICDTDVLWRKCYSPKDQGMIVRRGAVKFEVAEGQAGEIKRFQVEACRDHFHYEYAFHTDPCDYKSLVIKTPRNQTISIYGVKDKNGMLQQTELYHFTDHTGNEGDNTWFTLEPEHHLISSIWTDFTYIGLEWDIKKTLVEFDVHITASHRKTHAKFNLVDLSQLMVLENIALNSTGKNNKPTRDCNRLPFIAKQCKKNVKKLVVNATVKAKREFTVPARYLTENDGYEFVLPKKQFTNNTGSVIENQCSFAVKTKTEECRKHAVFNRIQHHFLCEYMKKVIAVYDVSRILDHSRILQACLFAYKTLGWTCSVMADRPRFDKAVFFAKVCPNEVSKIELYKDLIGRRNIQVTAKAIDRENRLLTTNPPTVDVNLQGPMPKLKGDSKEGAFKIIGITTDPPKISSLYYERYKVCVDYQCPLGVKDEEIQLIPQASSNPFTNITSCKDLTKQCCTTMKRANKNDIHKIVIGYILPRSKSIFKLELIPTVD